MQTIKDKNKVLARFGDSVEVGAGWTFFGDNDEPLQYGIGVFDGGYIMEPHEHKVRPRIMAHRTNEFILVLSGSIFVNIYGFDRKVIYDQPLFKGQWVAFHDGGHNVMITEDNTRLLEVKNGPFVSTELDKTRFKCK